MGKPRRFSEARLAKERGDLLEKSAVMQAVRDFHAAQATKFRSFLRRVWPKLKALPDGERDKSWEAETEQFLAAYQHELSFA